MFSKVFKKINFLKKFVNIFSKQNLIIMKPLFIFVLHEGNDYYIFNCLI